MLEDAEELGLLALTDDDVQRLYQTVYFLHRDPAQVRGVIQDAVEWSPTIQARQERHPETRQPVRTRPERFVALLQLSLFEVSVQRWERDLAQWTHQPTPAVPPEAASLLTQYLTQLAWHGIRHEDSIYTAISVGCLLYRYAPLEVCRVLARPTDNRGRIKSRLQRWIEPRFTHVVLLHDGALVTRSPTAGERLQIHHALTLFTPWGSDCIAPDVFDALALPLGFDDATLSAQDRKHALMHADCAGLECLVCAWNRHCPHECLDDPATRLEVPMFPTSGPPTPEDGDEKSPPPLGARELRELRGQMADWLQRVQRRRRAKAFHRLRVCVDGQEQLACTPGTRTLSFMLPLSAIRLQVLGQDAEGDLPLALFYLPDLEELGDTECLYAVLHGGETIELVLSPVRGQGGEVTAGRAAMSFWADEVQVPLRDRADEDVADLSLAAHETLAPDTGLVASPMLQEAQDAEGTQTEATSTRHLRLLHTPRERPEPRSTARWSGGSTVPLRPVVKVSAEEEAAAGTDSEEPLIEIYQSPDGLVTATVRVLAPGEFAVAIETKEPQCAAHQWHFRFARHADDTELCRGTLTLEAVEPGFWEGRVELALNVPEPWSFQFYSLPSDPGDTL